MIPIIKDLNDNINIRYACETYGFFYIPFNNIDLEDILNYSKHFFNQSKLVEKNWTKRILIHVISSPALTLPCCRICHQLYSIKNLMNKKG
jgi:hypothetical protein